MTTTVCSDQHKFKDFLEIPPRKLLFSPSSSPHRHETATNFNKLLPCNNGGDDNDFGFNGSDSDPYGSDHFRMYEFKVRRCNRSRSHDWTDCPFAHPGEKARRRDPRRFKYSSTVCADFRRGGGCPRGDDCEFAHGVFECWLHPTRYRTEACKDGKSCQRKICFFAHVPKELRILPPEEPSPRGKNGVGFCDSPVKKSQCCLFCHPVTSSPTSTLFNRSHFSRSPSLSPPLSPVKNPNSLSGYSPISRYALSKLSSELGTGNAFNELISSIEAMNFNEMSSLSPMGRSPTAAMNLNIPWFGSRSNVDDQLQFLPSPVLPQRALNHHPEVFMSRGFTEDHLGKVKDNELAPDLGWVNELLM